MDSDGKPACLQSVYKSIRSEFFFNIFRYLLSINSSDIFRESIRLFTWQFYAPITRLLHWQTESLSRLAEWRSFTCIVELCKWFHMKTKYLAGCTYLACNILQINKVFKLLSGYLTVCHSPSHTAGYNSYGSPRTVYGHETYCRIEWNLPYPFHWYQSFFFALVNSLSTKGTSNKNCAYQSGKCNGPVWILAFTDLVWFNMDLLITHP